MSEGDTYPLDHSAEMWRNRALQAEADLKDECNRHGEILFVVEAENARLRKAALYTMGRLQLDIDSGDRPDQWSMQDIVDKHRAALEVGK